MISNGLELATDSLKQDSEVYNIVMASEYLVYIDESGDENLKTALEGTTRLYAICAVLVSENDNLAVANEIKRLEDKYHCGPGGFKSSKIGGNWSRRLQVIEDISALPIRYITLIVDKEILSRHSSPGFHFKPVFRKYFSRIVYQHLDNFFLDNPDSSSTIYSDSYGTDSFQKEFTNYISKYYETNLFRQFRLSPISIKSTESPQVRVADIIAGTWRLLQERYEDVTHSANMAEIREVLRKCELVAERYPRKPIANEVADSSRHHAESDSIILAKNLQICAAFLEANKGNNDSSIICQSFILEILISTQIFETVSARTYRYVPELCSLLQEAGLGKWNEQKFRASILKPLRKIGIIIVGRTDGIRLATCLPDIHDLVKTTDQRVGPQLLRLKDIEASIQEWIGYSIWSPGEHNSLQKATNAYWDGTRGLF